MNGARNLYAVYGTYELEHGLETSLDLARVVGNQATERTIR